MENTGYTKALDSVGRVIIPKKLRQQLSLRPGDDLMMYLYTDDNGIQYLCLQLPDKRQEKKMQAKELLEELGVELPEELR